MIDASSGGDVLRLRRGRVILRAASCVQALRADDPRHRVCARRNAGRPLRPFVCQLWTEEPTLLASVARWFGVRPEHVARCRDHILDNWDAWDGVWDIDAPGELGDGEDMAAPKSAAVANNFTRLACACRYARWLPAFLDGDAYLTAIAASYRLDQPSVQRHATALVRQITERLNEFRLDVLIAQDVKNLLKRFYRQHIPGRTRINALAEEAHAALEDELRSASRDETVVWSRQFPQWVRSVALRVLLTRGQQGAGVDSPRAIFDRLKPHLRDGVARLDATQRAGPDVDARKRRRATTLARKRIERGVFLPAGLKPVAAYTIRRS